jgi:hypothetical protein
MAKLFIQMLAIHRGDCARTVYELNVFVPLGIGLSEKQIPRFVGYARSWW